MNIQQIKDTYSMADILDRCNIRLHRGNFCTCPFHKADDTPSLKVYPKSFYCFACGKGGDIITFVQLYNGLGFKEACEWISGEHLSKRSKEHIAIAQIRRKEKEKKKEELQKELDKIHAEFTGLWERIENTKPVSEEDPFPDEWCEAVNKWWLLCYQQDAIDKELEGVH